MTLNLQSLIQRNDENFLANQIGNDMVMMNLETGDYVGINHIGFDIWQQLDSPKKVSELLTYLLNSYEVDPKQCEEDTFRYLQHLLDLKILKIIL